VLHFRHIVLLSIPPFLALAALRPCEAQEPLSASERQEFNYAFATQIGSGIYDISGRTLQVYRLPLSVSFPQSEDTERGWRLMFPMTFGFFDLQAEDIFDSSSLGENIATFSLVPGVEFLVPVRDSWLLKPFAEAGYVWDRSGEADAAIYSTGLLSRIAFEDGGFNMVVGSGLTYALVDPASHAGADGMVGLEAAFAASHLFGKTGQGQADYEPYLAVRAFFGGVDEPLGAGSNTLVEYEAGVTFGSREAVKFWGIPLPRVGLGYVFGRELSSLRIVFGIPAESLRR